MGDVTTALNDPAARSVDEFGGLAAIISDPALLSDDRARRVVAAICDEWDSLGTRNQLEAAEFIAAAATSNNPYLMVDAMELVLTSESALPTVSSRLRERIQDVAAEAGFRAEVALEGWVRLCLGGWGRPLAVRAALDAHVAALLAAEQEPTPYLIRALGAAMDVWDDIDLETAMRALANSGDVPDAAVELAFRSIRDAVEAPDTAQASAALHTAIGWFDTALDDDEARPDARAFRHATVLLHAFAEGQAVDASDAASLRVDVVEYLTGLVGTAPTWRQPRADTAYRWLELIENLADLDDLDDVWLNAGAVIASTGRMLQTSRTMQIVTHADTSTSPTGNRGLRELVRPRLTAGFSAVADIARQLDRWLKDATDAALIAEVVAFRDTLRGDVDPKASAGHEDPPDARHDPIDRRVQYILNVDDRSFSRMQRHAAKNADLAELFEVIAARNAGLSVAEDQQVRELMGAVENILGSLGTAHLALNAVCTALTRFASTHIDMSQSTETRAQWLGEKGAPQPESTFSNALRDWFRADGVIALREVPDVAGGRSDIVVLVDEHRFVIESKRVLRARTFDQLTASYGTQATQYQATGTPTAFLVVVDHGRRSVRTDLTGTFDVRQWTLPNSTRTYALVTMRVLGNVATPSDASR